MGNVGNDFGAVEVGTKSTCRFDYRNSVLVEFVDQVCYEFRALADVFHIEGLEESYGHGFHRPHFHSAVS